MTKPIKVLLIEDDPNQSQQFQTLFQRVRGVHFEVIIADQLSKGLQELKGETVDAVLLEALHPAFVDRRTGGRQHLAGTRLRHVEREARGGLAEHLRGAAVAGVAVAGHLRADRAAVARLAAEWFATRFVAGTGQ